MLGSNSLHFNARSIIPWPKWATDRLNLGSGRWAAAWLWENVCINYLSRRWIGGRTRFQVW